jgi:ABC-type nitrate/sulfonate/bicarbonate transport system permease component
MIRLRHQLTSGAMLPELFRMDQVILGMAVIGAVGFGLNVLLGRIGHLPLWHGLEETP